MSDERSRLIGQPGPWLTLFAFVLVGSTTAAVMLTAVASLALSSIVDGLALVALPALLFLFTVILGFGPALAVGVVALIIRPRLKTLLAYALACLVVGAGAWSALYLLLDRNSGGQPLIAIFGGVSALICALLTWRLSARAKGV
ncbi:MAG: hypothetical protein Q8L23_12730 [Caulobacter sp.]|nr:hypothetical protein [Caulobacter sp.]